MTKKITVILTAAVALSCLFYCMCRKSYSGRTFIISYHRIEEFRGGLRGLCVRPPVFDAQLRYLHARGFRTISLSGLIELLKTGAPIPRKVFVITLDDGYENNYLNAFPVLKKYNFTATVFLHAEAIGKIYAYPRTPYPDRHLSRAQIAEMSGYLDFGSHSMSHPDLTELTPDKIFRELLDSKTAIEKIVKKPVDTFCYPFGRHNDAVKDITKKLYAGACTTRPGLVDGRSDPYSLPRFDFKETKAMGLNDIYEARNFYLKIFLGI